MIAKHGHWFTPFAAAVAAAALLAGCAAPGPLSTSPWPFGLGARDQSLRKQVEADPFPSAKQVGLQQRDGA
jgi:hypothetical protein